MQVGKKVFVNGCFDILHRGHIELFNYAKSQGDILFVGIDSNDRVQKLKGKSRPINSQEDRKFLLENIKAIDKVFIFNCENDLVELVKQIKPDIMIVGSDYKNKIVIGSEFAKKLLFFDRIDGYSTTKIIQSASNW